MLVAQLYYYSYLFDYGVLEGNTYARFINKQNANTQTTDIQQNFIGDFKIASLRNRMVIGVDYFKDHELEKMYHNSFAAQTNCSFVLMEGTNLRGVRITYPPGQWTKGKGEDLAEEEWPHPKSSTAYFQTIYLDPAVAGKGWGKKLSEKSLAILKGLGVKGVVCHSWKESPYNSSNRYLTALGFVSVAEYPSYWKNCSCGICTTELCECTAVEMYLNLEPK